MFKTFLVNYLSLILLFTTIACSHSESIVEDSSGNEYPILEFNKKKWLAQNLNFKTSNSWCFDNDENNCSTFGRLYTWKAAQSACNSLGNGWRLPTEKEWLELISQFGGYRIGEKRIGNTKKGYNALIDGGVSGF